MIIRIEGKNQVKRKGFCPNPVALYGIPEYADSKSFPEIKNTPDWREWWEEQISRCICGYETGGKWIPGRYYYYLNFAYMFTVGRGFHNPDFVDTDLDFFNLIEYCKLNHRGIISIKARRRGLSFKSNKGVLEYGTKFLGDKYVGGVCAGLKKYAEDFYQKLTDTEAITAPELQLNVLTSNTEERVYGYEEKTASGQYVDAGSLNQILVRTAFQSGNVFKGTALDDCIFEESGEFPNLFDTYEATKWCFMDGETMVGTPYIYGTGGNMNSSSQDFAEMWSSADTFGLERFWVPGTKIYKPCWAGHTNSKGRVQEIIPNIEKEYKDKDKTSIFGMEDYKEAERLIRLNRVLLSQHKNKKLLIQHLQNNPLSVEEAFISSADNNYDTDILQKRIMDLMQLDELHLDVVLEPLLDSDGTLVKPLQTKIRLADKDPESPSRDAEWKIAKLYDWPNKDYHFLDDIGVDSYDQDQSQTSKSLGGILVYRKKSPILPIKSKTGPIFTYYKRPPRKEDFYMIAILTGLAYGSPNSVLVDAGSPMIIDAFVQNQVEFLLAYRPKAFESPHSKQVHTYGLKFTPFNRPTLESLAQTEILDNAHTWFDPELCKDCATYNTGDNENDNDLHDALLLALALKKDRNLKVKPSTPVDKIPEPTPIRDEKGNVYYEDVNSDNSRFGGDLFMQLLSKGKIR